MINKPVYLGLSILDLIKTVMQCIVHLKIDDIYKDLAEDFQRRLDASNFEIERSLRKVKNEKVIWLMKDELGGQKMMGFVELRAKTYSFLKDNNDEDKKAKGIKNCVSKETWTSRLWKLFRSISNKEKNKLLKKK